MDLAGAPPCLYFDNPKDNAPSRSDIIVAENESDALHEARSKMGSLCSPAEVIPLEVTANPESSRLSLHCGLPTRAISKGPAPMAIPAGAIFSRVCHSIRPSAGCYS